MARTESAKRRMVETWFPLTQGLEKDEVVSIEQQSLELAAQLIRRRLNLPPQDVPLDEHSQAYALAQHRFLDLCTTSQGQDRLETLFQDKITSKEDTNVILGAIFTIQSLCVMATQVDATEADAANSKLRQQLYRDEWDREIFDISTWTRDSTLRLKLQVLQTPATQLLATLAWKRSHQGALNLLIALEAWTRHENTALLRSGFPIRFTEEQERMAWEAGQEERDVDELLGIRRDLRQSHKIYTIDSTFTTEIDDGLSVEVLMNEDGSTRQKFWIHIADVERWASPSSNVWEIAKARATTHYLPTGSIPMIPSSLSSDIMSLKRYTPKHALSLGVELNADGSVDEDSIEVTPSKIFIDYGLSYDEVDEMFQEGVAYHEEWQLGAMLTAAIKRRKYRISRGSSEGFIPNPIPQCTVSTVPDSKAADEIGIKLTIEASHNAGRNITEFPAVGLEVSVAPTVSNSNLLVTEMMILAGEALGRWKIRNDQEPPTFCGRLENQLRLGFRCQSDPDFKSREKEAKILEGLLKYSPGDGYCHAWYARRFFNPVQIIETPQKHSGLGLDCYVQWSSPIRRFGDLQVHVAVKRYLRRKKVHDMLFQGSPIPSELRQSDLGCPLPDDQTSYDVVLDDDIDYRWGQAVMTASRKIQRKSQDYWMYEYLNRYWDTPVFDAIVLGCVNPSKKQYAVYLPELGYEHRYTSEVGELVVGRRLKLTPTKIYPRFSLLTLSLAQQKN